MFSCFDKDVVYHFTLCHCLVVFLALLAHTFDWTAAVKFDKKIWYGFCLLQHGLKLFALGQCYITVTFVPAVDIVLSYLSKRATHCVSSRITPVT